MLLVAGGQHDPNIGWLLRRVLARGIAFADVLNGPDLKPDLAYDLADRSLRLNGRRIRPTGVFQRHNVFLAAYGDTADAHAEALNWFYFLRGWACAERRVRCFNRDAAETGKLENLHRAQAARLRIPETVVACTPPPRHGARALIRKPVAGGELTEIVGRSDDPPARWRPYFYQTRLKRPELRVFVVGRRLFGCALTSDHVDYRDDTATQLKAAAVPPEVGRGLLRLCAGLGLDFAAADFMRDAQGRYRFLEVNTQPMFVAFDKALDGALCDAILDHLTA